MSNGAEVIVIGGGVVGSACAWALARRGAEVLVLEPGDAPGQGWQAAAGMLAAQIEADADDPLLPLDLAGRAFYRREAAALREVVGIDIGLVNCGILEVARSEREAEALKSRVAWQRQQAQRADWLEAGEVRDGWPWLAPTLGGFWAPEDGALDPARLVEALRAASTAHGAEWVRDAATGLDVSGERLGGVIGRATRYTADRVVIASGAWAGRCANVPRPVSVEPVRGQMAAFSWPDGIPPAIVYGAGGYLLWRNGELVAGSTMEHSGFEIDVTAPGIAGIRARAGEIYPPLRDTPPIRTWAGLRPMTPDGRPIIGPEPRLAGLWYATGHGRRGILQAGITGELVAQGLEGGVLAPELLPADPSRFWSW